MALLPLLDTNPIVRHVVGDHLDHTPRATAMFERIARSELRVRTTDTVIFEAIFTLEKLYKITRTAIRDALLAILRLPDVVLPGKVHYERVFDLWLQHRPLSFADCYHAAMVKRGAASAIISFDRGFDRLATVTRIEPQASAAYFRARYTSVRTRLSRSA